MVLVCVETRLGSCESLGVCIYERGSCIIFFVPAPVLLTVFVLDTRVPITYLRWACG